MDNNHLPQAITLSRFLRSLNLNFLGDSIQCAGENTEYSIQTFDFKDFRTITLPMLGERIHLQPEDRFITLTISDDPGKTLHLMQSEHLAWDVFCENAHNWIERELGRILAVSEQYSQELAEQLANGSSFSALGHLRSRLGFDLFIINKKFEILKWVGGNELPLNPIPFVFPKRPLLKPVNISHALFQGAWVDPQNVQLTWYPLFGQHGTLGYFGLAASIESLGSIEHLFLHKSATLFLLELTKVQSVQENESHYHRDFLFDLLYNNFDSLEVIVSRGKLWGWDFSKPHLVVVGEIPGFDPDSPQQDVFEDILIDIMAILRNRRPKAICLERNGQLVMLFPLKEMLTPASWNEEAQTLLQPVFQLMANYPKEYQLGFGLGNLYPTARYIHRSFQEARSALELGQLFNIHNSIVAFQDLGVMRLLYKLDRQELDDFRNEILGPLLEFDKENNLALEDTLLAYLACSTDLNAAGDKLFLHPNTLRYRLKKITEILGRDLSILENQMNLFIALKVGKLKSLWPE